MSPRVTVATSRAFPDLGGDGPVLLPALREAGADVRVAVWDDPQVDWAAAGLVLVRSTWDYAPRREEYLAWARGCPRIANPAPVLGWNTDKHYLQELAAAGVPVVPTAFLEPGEPLVVPEAWRGGDVVVKPAVSAGAVDALRAAPDDPRLAALVARLHRAGRTAMLQPYLDRLDAEGETAVLVLAGAPSHAVRKGALLTAPDGLAPRTSDDDVAESILPAVATPEQAALAARVLAAVPGGPGQLLYARVDLVPGPDGSPVLLELELTEPSLFLEHAPAAAVARFAADVVAAAA